MSAAIETVLICDGDKCGKTFGEENKNRSVLEQREEARKKGWGQSNGKDYCGACRKRRAAAPPKPESYTFNNRFPDLE